MGLRLAERDAGLYVDMVIPGLAAARCGVELGHQLLEVDGVRVVSREHAAELLGSYAERGVLVLTLRPPPHQRTLVVASAPLSEASSATTARARPHLGFSLTEMDGELHVGRVTEGSPAAAAGVRAGDILVSFEGEAATQEAAVRTRIGGMVPGQSVRLVTRGPARSVTVTEPVAPTARLPAVPSAEPIPSSSPRSVTRWSDERSATSEQNWGSAPPRPATVTYNYAKPAAITLGVLLTIGAIFNAALASRATEPGVFIGASVVGFGLGTWGIVAGAVSD